MHSSSPAGTVAPDGVPIVFHRKPTGLPTAAPKRGILLFNPWATRTGRVPNSLLHIAAALGDGHAEIAITSAR